MDLKTLEGVSGPTVAVLLIALIVQARFLFTRLRRVLGGFKKSMQKHEERDQERHAALLAALKENTAAVAAIGEQGWEADGEREYRPRPRRKKKARPKIRPGRNGID